MMGVKENNKSSVGENFTIGTPESQRDDLNFVKKKSKCFSSQTTKKVCSCMWESQMQI